MNRLQERYRSEVVPALTRDFAYANRLQVPNVDKIVVNVGLGEALKNAKAIDAATGDLATVTGQKPVVTRARKSIAQFRLRAGNPIGAFVTLRGERMWDFLDRFISIALPRIRDFRGLPGKSFDGRTVVDHIDLGVRSGEIYGFLGPNGSGKTTFIRMLCGLLRANEGSGTCLGYNVLTEQREIDLAVHWVLGNPQVFLNTVGDVGLLPKVLDAAERFDRRPPDEALEALGAASLFS